MGHVPIIRLEIWQKTILPFLWYILSSKSSWFDLRKHIFNYIHMHSPDQTFIKHTLRYTQLNALLTSSYGPRDPKVMFNKSGIFKKQQMNTFPASQVLGIWRKDWAGGNKQLFWLWQKINGGKYQGKNNTRLLLRIAILSVLLPEDLQTMYNWDNFNHFKSLALLKIKRADSQHPFERIIIKHDYCYH